MASEKITALIEEVKALTVLELSELVHALEDELLLLPLLLPLLRLLLRRPSSTSCWQASATRRSRSSRLSVRLPAWAWLTLRLSSRLLLRPSRKAFPRTRLRS